MEKILTLCAVVLCGVQAMKFCNETAMDAVSKSYLSAEVFLGVVESLEFGNESVMVEFTVERPLKGNYSQIQRNRTALEYTKGIADCVSKFQLGKAYIVFAERNQLSDIVPSFAPVSSTQIKLKNIEKILCSGCAKPPSVKGLSDVTVEVGRSVTLKCRADGNPVPTIEWYKEEKKLANENGIVIQTIKKHSFGRIYRLSRLTIKSANRSDNGQYVCKCKNVVAKTHVYLAANVSVVPPHKLTPCPEYDFACYNGGTCFKDDMNEYLCICAPGFHGHTCQEKYVRVDISRLNSNALLRSFVGASTLKSEEENEIAL